MLQVHLSLYRKKLSRHATCVSNQRSGPDASDGQSGHGNSADALRIRRFGAVIHRIPARYREPGWGLWVLSHVDLRTTARVRIFRDFLVAELEKKKNPLEGSANKNELAVE